MTTDTWQRDEQAARWVREGRNLVSALPRTRCRIIAQPVTHFSQLGALLDTIRALSGVRDLRVAGLEDGVLNLDVLCVTPRALAVALRAAGYAASSADDSDTVQLPLSAA